MTRSHRWTSLSSLASLLSTLLLTGSFWASLRLASLLFVKAIQDQVILIINAKTSMPYVLNYWLPFFFFLLLVMSTTSSWQQLLFQISGLTFLVFFFLIFAIPSESSRWSTAFAAVQGMLSLILFLPSLLLLSSMLLLSSIMLLSSLSLLLWSLSPFHHFWSYLDFVLIVSWRVRSWNKKIISFVILVLKSLGSHLSSKNHRPQQ